MLLEQHYCLLKCVYFKSRNQIWKMKKMTDFKRLHLYTKLLFKCFYHAKCYQNQVEMMCSQSWIPQEFFNWPFFPVKFGGDPVYHVSETRKEQSQHRAHQRNSLTLFFWAVHVRNQQPVSPNEQCTLNISPVLRLWVNILRIPTTVST